MLRTSFVAGWCVLIGITLPFISGCGPVEVLTDDSPPEQVLGSTPPLPPVVDDSSVSPSPGDGSVVDGGSQQPVDPVSDYTESEPNDDWGQAHPVPFVERVTLHGDIAPTGQIDHDVYNLGPGYAGDFVEVELVLHSGSNVVVGVFDDRGRVLNYAKHSGYGTTRRFDFSLYQSTSALLVVASTITGSGSTRPYDISVDVSRASMPQPRPQKVLLDFDGGSDVQIGGRSPVNVPAFDAAAIDPVFGPSTGIIKQRVLDMVREDYSGLNVEIYSTDEGLPSGEYTSVFFGTYNPSLLGLADNIDEYNKNLTQEAIIYTDTFSLFAKLDPTVEEIAQALANVASHEAGHLLGLRHTKDIYDIMDISATARQMLKDQWFRAVDLHPDIMLIGLQDSPMLLQWTVGGTLNPPDAGKVFYRHFAKATSGTEEDDFHIPREWLCSCSAGDHDHSEHELLPID